MNGNQTLYIDQWNNHYWAKTVKELRSQVGAESADCKKPELK